jgi:Family of unknown function (DUF6328)
VDHDPTDPRSESPSERVDRNLTELLGELRVALPGVQVLFAFLLVVPFNQRFASTTPLQRQVYFASLLLTAAASVFLIAPTVHHRIWFRMQKKEEVVVTGNRLAVIGMTLLALAMVGAVLLVTDFLAGDLAAFVAAGAFAALFGVVWYLLPIARRSG